MMMTGGGMGGRSGAAVSQRRGASAGPMGSTGGAGAGAGAQWRAGATAGLVGARRGGLRRVGGAVSLTIRAAGPPTDFATVTADGISLTRGGKKRVVVTGLGAVTAHGNDVDDFYAKLLAGESAVSTISEWPAKVGATQITLALLFRY